MNKIKSLRITISITAIFLSVCFSLITLSKHIESFSLKDYIIAFLPTAGMIIGVILLLSYKKIGSWIITVLAFCFNILDLTKILNGIKLVPSETNNLHEITLPGYINYIMIAEIILFLLLVFLLFLHYRLNRVELATGTIKDPRDGKVYRIMIIGKQTIMAENLAYKTDEDCWAIDNKEENVSMYGYLYNQNTARRAAKGIKGWHIPSKKEWQALINHLGGEDIAGGKMKDVDKKLWDSPNTGATNESGFGALPAGFHGATGGFFHKGERANFWSRTYFVSPERCWKCSLNHKENKAILDFEYYYYGFSVRLFKNGLF